MTTKHGNDRHNRFRKYLAAAVVLLVTLLIFSAASAADRTAEARGMLTLINDFRTGGNAWCWDKNNTAKTVVTGLAPLEYDLELEEVALVRAAELAVRFDHTRPDGSKWSTAFPAGNYAKAENLAYGFTSAEAAFEGFLEEDEDYKGQGHRRNMLRKEMTRVGIAAVEIDGTVYWVQEFASGSVKNPLSLDGSWVLQDGKYYFRKLDGTWATGWLKDADNWYYLDDEGAMQTGWQQVAGEWYRFADNGAMQTGWQHIDGNWYLFGDSGIMQTGWQQVGGKWYCFDNDGVMRTGWHRIDGNWYCFDAGGIMHTGWQKIDGHWYLFDGSGVMQTGWQESAGKWYYFASGGAMQTGWKELNGIWYYFHSSGEMATGTVRIDGKTEVFSSSGAWSYTEISDYDTPLGDGFWIRTMLQVRQWLRFVF